MTHASRIDTNAILRPINKMAAAGTRANSRVSGATGTKVSVADIDPVRWREAFKKTGKSIEELEKRARAAGYGSGEVALLIAYLLQ